VPPPVETPQPGISSEALATAIKEADITYNLMKGASALDSQKLTEA
jgi:hypothetical protein